MNSFIGSLRIYLRRAFLSFPFWITIALVVILNYCASAIEMKLSSHYTVMYLLSTFCFSGDYIIVVLFLGGLPYAKAFVTDWNTQFLRLQLIRTSPDGYAWSKVVTVFLSSFISIFLGFFLTIACFSLHMPFVDENFWLGGMDSVPVYGLLIDNSWFLFFAVQISVLALGVAVWSVCSLLVSAYATNSFVALTSPVIGYYLVINSIGRFLPVYLKMDRFMLGKIALGNIPSTFLYTLFYFLLLIALLGFGFVRKVKRRVDRG